MRAVFVGLRDAGARAGPPWYGLALQGFTSSSSRYRSDLPTEEEESAKVRRVELWKDAKLVPPWDWRRKRSDK